MSIGQAAGEHKAINAIKQALFHPLLEDISLANASGVIVNFTSGSDLTLMDIGQALGYLQEQIPPDAELIFGTTQQARFQGQVQVNLIVTGLGADTFDDIFGEFTRDAGQVPVQMSRPESSKPADHREIQLENTARGEMEKAAAGSVEAAKDPLDVPAFMRRKAYANISFGS